MRGKKWLWLPIIFLIGFAVRLYPLFTAGFETSVPFGCGGLYVQFAKEIRQAHYRLPIRIPYYTLEGVPYAYPPLAFYILALLFDFTPVSEFAAMNFLPTLISCFTVIAFYALAKTIFPGPRFALAASLIYALLPAAFIEHTFGDGLVEALGTFSYIGAMVAMARLNRRNDFISSLLLGAAIGLNVYSSPGAAYATVISILVFWVSSPGRCSLSRLVIAIGVGALLSVPYLVIVSANHSPDIFFRTWFRQHSIKQAFEKMWFDRTGEPHLALLGLLTLMGLFRSVLCGEYWKAVWFFATYLVPREYQYLMAVPMAGLAAEGLFQVLLPGVSQIAPAGFVHRLNLQKAHIRAIAILGVFVYGVASAIAVAGFLPEQQAFVSKDELAMMEWIRRHTDRASAFLVIGDEIEWFPEIVERATVNVVQGSEWVRDDWVYQFHRAVDQCETLSCCLGVATDYGVFPDYVYVSKSADRTSMIETAGLENRLRVVEENDGAILFRVAW
jgi:hypothetical protein